MCSLPEKRDAQCGPNLTRNKEARYERSGRTLRSGLLTVLLGAMFATRGSWLLTLGDSQVLGTAPFYVDPRRPAFLPQAPSAARR